MRFGKFMKDRGIEFGMILFLCITIAIFLLPYPQVHIVIKLYILLAIPLIYFLTILIDFERKKSFYTNMMANTKSLEEKYLVCEMLEKPAFLEGKIISDVLKETGKSMLENVNNYKHQQEEYKEYIELWIHEIKLPIATSKMIIENNKSEVTKNIGEELDKVEGYVEQALFYARSNTVEKDYYIKKIKLEEIVHPVIQKNKKELLSKNIKVELDNLEQEVYTDGKWCEFILNQILGNSIKYAKQKNAVIKIQAEAKKEQVILRIEDNGIGIKKGEITRVFEKGFTGTNGRKGTQKSTGIGLYLCKKLCNKLRMGIELNAKEEEGTEIRLVFPRNSYTIMEGQPPDGQKCPSGGQV